MESVSHLEDNNRQPMKVPKHSLHLTSGKSTLNKLLRQWLVTRQWVRNQAKVRAVRLERQANSPIKMWRTSCRDKDRLHRSYGNHTRRHRASSNRKIQASLVQEACKVLHHLLARKNQLLRVMIAITAQLEVESVGVLGLALLQTYSTRSRFRRSTRPWEPRFMTLEASVHPHTSSSKSFHLAAWRERAPQCGGPPTMTTGTIKTDQSKSRRASRQSL